jgi:hypothetical protein
MAYSKSQAQGAEETRRLVACLVHRQGGGAGPSGYDLRIVGAPTRAGAL